MEKFSMNKLDDANYETWKLYMRSILICNDLWNCIEGDVPTAAAALEVWNVKDSKALALILLNVSENLLEYIKNATTAKDAWKNLKDIYGSRGPAKKIMLYKKLFSLKKSLSNTMQEHIREFLSISDKIEETGIIIPKELLVVMLLNSLPADYENFRVALEARDDLPDLKTLKIKLLEEENRKNEKTHDDQESENAFVSQSYRKNYEKNKDFKHFYNNKKNRGNIFQGTCFKCNKRGHKAVNCRTIRARETAMLSGINLHNEEVWCLDSGATAHMCKNKNSFLKWNNQELSIIETAGVNDTITAHGSGTVRLNNRVLLIDVIFVPDLKHNLISISKIIESGHMVIFEDNYAVIKNKSNEVIFKAFKVNKLYFVSSNTGNNKSLITNNCKINNVKMWHERFGHLNFNDLKRLKMNELLIGFDLNFDQNKLKCIPCLEGKIKQFPYNLSENKEKYILGTVHSDICGPFQTSLGGSKYFITFIDEKSRYVHVTFLKERSEALDAFKTYKSRFENETGNKIKIFRSDNAKEYVSKSFKEFLNNNGIVHQLSVPYTPQQNGIAERINRTLVEMSRTMLIQANLPKYLWAEAINTAAFIRNRCPSSAINFCTPFEMLKNKRANVSYFKIFGSIAVALNKKPGRSKLDAKGKKYIFVGYDNFTKGYRLFDNENRKIVISRDVEVIENVKSENYVWLNMYMNENEYHKEIETKKDKKMLLDDDNKLLPENIPEVQSKNCEENILDDENEIYTSCDDTENEYEQNSDNITEDTSSVKKSGRPRLLRTGKRGRPRILREEVNFAFNNFNNFPISFENAMQSVDKNKWIDAINEEMNAHNKNKTWVIVDRPINKNIISNRWVFTKKFNQDGNLEKYKARLVARGCQQKEGIDFDEIFSPVVRYETLKTLFAVCAEKKMTIHHMDVVTAFVQGTLTDEVYMEIPKGPCLKPNKDKVCKLLRPLYGLKQASRQWHHKINKFLEETGMEASKADRCLYIKNQHEKQVIIAVYVDDLVIASNCNELLKVIKHKLASSFEMKDLGEIKNILGISVKNDFKNGILELNQRQYIKKMLKIFNMENAKESSTPMECNFLSELRKLHGNQNENNQIKNKPYRELIGSLQYLAHTTRPDIAFPTNILSRFTSNPLQECWIAAKRVLKYLKGTMDYKITYKSSKRHNMIGYTDSDWASDPTDRKSCSGYIIMMNGGPITWKVKKQKSTSLSTMEAEYVAFSEITKEVIYMRQLLKDMGIKIDRSTTIYCDNQSCIEFAKDGATHEKAKHIDIRYHFCKQKISEGIVNIEYIRTENNVADLMTKSLSKPKHENCVKALNIS